MRKLLPLTAGVLLAAGGLAPAAASASPPATAAPTAAAPACATAWGSLGVVVHLQSAAPIHDLRAGRHDCYDRLVMDLGPGKPAGYDVRYVPQVIQNGSGLPVSLAGGAFLQVSVFTPANDANYIPTYDPANPRHAVDVSGYSTFRQVAWLGSNEPSPLAVASGIGLGVRAQLPFRVFAVAGPGTGSRLVIDVAHRW